MSGEDAPSLVGAGSIIIDDIVLPDGQTFMGQLGGGVVHALMGAVIWDERPGLCGLAGHDLPEEAATRLARYMDMRGLVQLDMPQMRAWQLFEYDGSRTEVHRVKNVAPYVAGTSPDHLPDAYQDSQAFYLLQDFEGVTHWSAAVNGIKLWEPNALVMTSKNRQAMRDALSTSSIDVVSPNLVEARAVYGQASPEALLDSMFADGAQAVVLRMGVEGSLIGVRGDTIQHVEAYPVDQVADQTGAGNTYCGGMLVGLMRGLDLRDAAAMGTVSASFCVEAVGVLDPDRCNRDERDRRLAWIRRGWE